MWVKGERILTRSTPAFSMRWTTAGGLYAVARSLEDVADLLDAAGVLLLVARARVRTRVVVVAAAGMSDAAVLTTGMLLAGALDVVVVSAAAVVTAADGGTEALWF
jgi:hypothetical protein